MIHSRCLQRPCHKLRSIHGHLKAPLRVGRHFSSNFTGAPPTARNPLRNALSSQTPWKNRQWQERMVTGTVPVRLQSTAPTPVAETIQAAPDPPYSTSPSTDPFLTDDFTSTPESPIYDHLGFLKEMGLDYGWGPTAMIETLLEHVHIYAQTPWWASIAITVLIFRFGLLKFYVDAADTTARSLMIKDHLNPLMQRWNEAIATGNRMEARQLSVEMKELRAAAGVKMWKSFAPMLQFPLIFGNFRLLRGMTDLPVPGLETGGYLWIQDLTISDPYFILPLTTAVCTYYTFKLGGEQGALATMNPTIKTAMLYIFPTITFAFMSTWPAALQTAFFIGGTFTLLQSSLLRQLWFRNLLHIQPLPDQLPGGPRPKSMDTTYRYQPPTSPSARGGAVETNAKPKGFVAGFMAGVKKAAGEVTGQGKSLMGRREEKNGARRTAAELKYAKDYDVRRRREIAQQQFEMQQEREARRKERDEGRRMKH